ncbi:hypothetical protein ID866_2488 [Astraeus odoratus]|nr:hypothetical protein ID866_2488 [Astraeus odoratus]
MSLVTTTVLLSNLHCASCVHTIEEALGALQPPPTRVDVSIVHQAVILQHLNILSPETIRAALEDAAFDIFYPYDGSLRSDYPDVLPRRQAKHIQQCSLCQQEELAAPKNIAFRSKPDLIGASSLSIDEIPEDDVVKRTSRASITNSTERRSDTVPHRLNLAVTGMTCAACATSITEAVTRLSGVSQLFVDVLSNSATLVVENKDLIPFVTEAIEDCGFGAELHQVEPLLSTDRDSTTSGPRTISLQVHGMFCQHCPGKIMNALENLQPRLTIIKPLTSPANPVLEISYDPIPPEFTIRTIISAIVATDPRTYTVSVFKPPTLEIRTRALQKREQQALLRHLVFTFVFALPTFIFGVVYMSLVPSQNPTRRYIMKPIWQGNASLVQWLMFFLATPVMFYALLALAASQPPAANGEGDTTTYFDSVVFLTMFILCGRYLEAYAEALLVSPGPDSGDKPCSSDSNVDVEKGDPSSDNGNLTAGPGLKVERISVDLLEVGDIVRVLNGCSPPTDGTVVSNTETVFDESSLTGEAKLVKKITGDQVFLGTINKSKAVDVRIDTIRGMTMLDNIINVVREGQTHRAPIERVADAITGVFVPIVTLLAITTWMVWLVLGYSGVLPRDYLDVNVGGWAVWSLQFATAVFVVACPCGIGLAAPTALLVGSGVAAQHGILVRGGGEAFQEMAQIDVVAFDKTGTLTQGRQPQVSNCEITPVTNKWRREVLLGIAAELESASCHPLAAAIKHYAESQGGVPLNAVEFDEVAGMGVKGRFNTLGCTAAIGSEAWVSHEGAVIDATMASILEEWKKEAKSIVLLAVKDDANSTPDVVAMFAVVDPVRPEAESVVRGLHERGIETWMISGDNEITAKAVARAVGIPESSVIAGVLPHEKAQKIDWLQRNGGKRLSSGRWQFGRQRRSGTERWVVAMVGDGINDAPALAAADVSVAIGSGSEVAVANASFILLSSNLESLFTLADLSRKVLSRVKINFGWAFIYNLVAVPIAAGALYPFHHIRLAPTWASLAMALSSVSVVGSSLMLKLYKQPKVRINESTIH